MFHRFLIWPLIAGLKFSREKLFFTLLLLDRLKDFLEIKYVKSYLYEDMHLDKGFQVLPFVFFSYAPLDTFAQCLPSTTLTSATHQIFK